MPLAAAPNIRIWAAKIQSAFMASRPSPAKLRKVPAQVRSRATVVAILVVMFEYYLCRPPQG